MNSSAITMMSLIDKEIIDRLRDGSEEAFNWLVKNYSKKLLNIINSIIKDDDQSYDILQETMIRCYKHIRKFKGKSTLITWVTRIAINMSFTFLSNNRKNFESLYDKNDKDLTDKLNNSYFKADNPEDLVIDSINNKEINSIINSLDSIHKLTLRLKYFDKFTTKEIAEMTDVPEGTVRSRLYYARTYLRSELKYYI